jgi:hypothetical protein
MGTMGVTAVLFLLILAEGGEIPPGTNKFKLLNGDDFLLLSGPSDFFLLLG